MSTNPKEKSKNLEAAFQKILSAHGHGFHYALLAHVGTLGVRWDLEETEFPVHARGRSTHIDFVLRLRDSERRLFLVAECKRTNPALADWCFVKAPPIDPTVAVVCERVSVEMSPPREGFARPSILWPSPRVFQLGFPIKGTEKGDESGEGNDLLKKAVTQVSIATSGFVDFLATRGHNLLLHRPKLDAMAHASVLGAIFTNARLWSTTVNLADSNLQTGDVRATDLQAEPWLWLGQNISPDLKHSLRHPEPVITFTRLRDHVYKDAGRCIAIVSVDGVHAFLSQSLWHDA